MCSFTFSKVIQWARLSVCGAASGLWDLCLTSQLRNSNMGEECLKGSLLCELDYIYLDL